MPLPGKVLKAETISYTGTSAEPTQREGTGSSQQERPIECAIFTSAVGPSCFIRYAEMLLLLLVSPHLRVTVLPIHSGLSVLFGVQISSPTTKDCGTFTTLSQGVKPSCIARAYRKGLNVEPTCLFPWRTWSYLK